MNEEIRLKITLEAPPSGVAFGIQRGSGPADPRAVSDGADLSFTFPLRLRPARGADGIDFGGEYVQGRPGERFIYVAVGERAGSANSPWNRRAKVSLSAISPEAARKAVGASGLALEARIPGTMRDGSPVCATVKLLEPWRVVPHDSAARED